MGRIVRILQALLLLLTLVTTRPHLDDLITFDPSNDLLAEERQPDPFDILLAGGRIDSEGETYLSYEEMSSRELDSYYFRSD